MEVYVAFSHVDFGVRAGVLSKRGLRGEENCRTLPSGRPPLQQSTCCLPHRPTSFVITLDRTTDCVRITLISVDAVIRNDSATRHIIIVAPR